MNPTLKITAHDKEWCPQYFGVIVGIFCSLYMITIAINAKFFDFYGLVFPAGILTFPICCIITDTLTEIYGFNRTRQAVWTAVICTILFAIFAHIATLLKPPSFWTGQDSFQAVFKMSWRFAAAGCLAWIVGEFANSYVLSKMKILQNAKYMSLRFVASTAVGQFFDTIVFMAVAFALTMPWNKFSLMLLTVWLFKVGYEIVALPLSIPITKFIKILEGVEHFDRQALHVV